jgi:tRNA uridine 5-carbamoylmethylation protein Kti12
MKLIFIHGLPATGKLTIARELRRRIDSPSRLQYQKLTSVSLFEQLHANGSFDPSYMPESRVSIDTSLCTQTEAAREIARTVKLRSA